VLTLYSGLTHRGSQQHNAEQADHDLRTCFSCRAAKGMRTQHLALLFFVSLLSVQRGLALPSAKPIRVPKQPSASPWTGLVSLWRKQPPPPPPMPSSAFLAQQRAVGAASFGGSVALSWGLANLIAAGLGKTSWNVALSSSFAAFFAAVTVPGQTDADCTAPPKTAGFTRGSLPRKDTIMHVYNSEHDATQGDSTWSLAFPRGRICVSSRQLAGRLPYGVPSSF
jgi:hypothetical protein